MDAEQPRQRPADMDDNAYWIVPPPAAAPESSEDGVGVIDVAVHVLVWRIGPIDTVASTCDISISVLYEWTDPRLVGWSGELPKKLWGPRMYLSNMMGEINEKRPFFQLIDPEGLVDSPMSLQDFPFDQQAVAIELVSSQQFATVDGTGGIAEAGQSQYSLRHVGGPTGMGVNLMTWSGEIVEWKLHGVATEFVAGASNRGAVGGETTRFAVVFIVSRLTPYYFWKVLLPLYLVTALSFTAFHYETDDLVERSALTSTYFLSAFAMLYVVGDSLPKTHFLTRVDKLIVSTIVTISVSGLLGRAIYSIHLAQGPEVAAQWNLWIEASLAMIYLVSNLWVFGPPWLQMRRRTAKLEQAELPPPLPTSTIESPLAQQQQQQQQAQASERALPLVPEGGRYIRLEQLLELTQKGAAASATKPT